MAKIPALMETVDGWTEWHAIPNDYRLGCCDCGLMHDLESVVAKRVRRLRGAVQVETIDNADLQIMMRARRNPRSTAQMRRRTDWVKT